MRAAALALLAAAAWPASALAQAQDEGELAPEPAAEAARMGAERRPYGLAPYIEVRQSFDLDSIGDDFRSYTNITAGLNGFIDRERIQGSIGYRGTYRFPVSGGGSDRFSNTLFARVTAELLPRTVFVDASAYAALQTVDFRRGVIFDPDEQTSNGNLAQTTAFTISPRFRRELGDYAVLSGRYRLSYVNVDDTIGGSAPGFGGGSSGGNTPQSASFSDSVGQTFELTLANQPKGRLLASITALSTGEDQDQLEQRYRNQSLTLDLTYAVNRQFRLLANAGYSEYDSTQQAVLRAPIYLTSEPSSPSFPFFPFVTSLDDPLLFVNSFGRVIQPEPVLPAFLAQGFTSSRNINDPFAYINLAGQRVLVDITPVIDADGNFVADPTAPRRTLYKDSGLVWNVGARYTPSRRTNLELRVGQRFSSLVVTGTVSHRLRENLSIYGQLSDGIETFGNILTQTIDGIPTSFAIGRTRPGFQGGCVIGVDLSDETQCIDGQTQSITSGVFRSRIGTLGVTYDRGRTNYSLNYTYNAREYLDQGATQDPNAPPIDPGFAGRDDIVNRLDGRVTRTFRPGERASGTLYVASYSLGLSRPRDDFYIGAIGRYDRRLSDRLGGFGSLTVVRRFASGSDDAFSGSRNDTTNAVLSLGARYEF